MKEFRSPFVPVRRSSGGVEESHAQYRFSRMKRKYTQTELTMDGWDRVPAAQRWEFLDPHPRVHKDTTLNIPRHASKSDVFRALVPEHLIKALQPSFDSTKDAYVMWGFTAFAIANVPPAMHPSPSPLKEQPLLIELRDLVDRESNGASEAPGFHRFKRLQELFMITTSFARRELSSHLASVVVTWGETVALDEKMRTWRGESPHYKTVLSKPESRGHWTTQIVAMLQDVELPFCFGLYPFDSTVNLGETTEMSEIWDWALGLIPALGGPCIVADSYYLTRAQLGILLTRGARFTCSITPKSFKEYHDLLKEDVKEVGSTAVAYKPSENLMVTMHWDRDSKVGKKMVITNSLKLSRSSTPEVGLQTAYWLYRDRFSYCDRFNRCLHNYKYPFRRSTWEKNFDSLFVSTLLINAYHSWIYCNPTANEGTTLLEFTHQLGLELMRKST